MCQTRCACSIKRGDEFGIGVAQRIDRDARTEIEISLAILREEIGPFAPHERNVRTGIGWQQRRKHIFLQGSNRAGFIRRVAG